MDWEDKLISLYLYISKQYEEKLWVSAQRFTNGKHTHFTDSEVMTIYCYGIFRGFRTLKSIHSYTNDHMKQWFPKLPGYAAFVHRVNRLSSAFAELLNVIQSSEITGYEDGVYLVDSFPIVLAHHQHAYRAKVAPAVANKGFCSTKKLHFYGVRAHVVARKREGVLPEMECLQVEKASDHDGPIFDHLRTMMHDNLVFGDQAYKRPDADDIEARQSLKVFTPIKKAKGQKQLDPQQKAFSKEVSRMRQPIEALFAWVDRMTGIETASNVRSLSGLLSHIFGRFASAMILRHKPEFGF